MKKLICYLLLLLSLSANAQSQDVKPKVNPEIKRFVYQNNTTITKRTYDSIYFDIAYDKGANWVFKYSYRAQETDLIADDEYAETYEFEMAPPKGNSFTITSKDFEKNKVIFNRSCFCPDGGIRQLHEGTITGKKVGKNTWLVTFDITIEPRTGRSTVSTNKKFKGYFKPGNLIF
ncbi:MAG: hypothetical protein CFE21_14785 [Bacteroidetes bacterium B1(2017)]|nr:MAG: hypothetical protein CFE21_14785 [Bacteroidetes bacterium B1(2017)]